MNRLRLVHHQNCTGRDRCTPKMNHLELCFTGSQRKTNWYTCTGSTGIGGSKNFFIDFFSSFLGRALLAKRGIKPFQ